MSRKSNPHLLNPAGGWRRMPARDDGSGIDARIIARGKMDRNCHFPTGKKVLKAPSAAVLDRGSRAYLDRRFEAFAQNNLLFPFLWNACWPLLLLLLLSVAPPIEISRVNNALKP